MTTVNREYKKAFIGSNQDIGYDNPFLCYDSSTHLIKLLTDKITYFHMPDNTSSIPLSAAGLISDGAIPGSAPYYSDKIWKKMANYEKYTNWGNALPEYQQNGVWLCAWLSGNINNPDQTPIWKERWYNPGFITEFEAYIVNTSAVSDIDAQMSLDPKGLYAYFHMGDITTTNIVNLLSTFCDIKVNITDWNNLSTDIIANGNIETTTYSDFDKITNVLVLSGTDQYAYIPFNIENKVENGLSYNIWVFVDDWMNIKGNSILSNNFRGGWNLKYDNGYYTPFIAMYDISGKVIVLNTDGNVIMTKQLSGNSSPISINVDNECYIWVLDNGTKYLYKIDFTGNIVTYAELSSTHNYINSYIDNNSNIHLLSEVVSSYDSTYDMFCNYISSEELKVDIDYINTTSTGGKIRLDVTNYTILNNNNSICSFANNIDISCDNDNNLWVLLSGGYKKFTLNEGTYYLSLSGTIDADYINFTQENNVKYVWFINNNGTVYKYDTIGNLIKQISLSGYQTIGINGDFTGYQWCRMYGDRVPYINADIYLKSSVPSIDYTKYTLKSPCSALTDNYWHMFTYTFNPTSGYIKLYVDSIQKDQATIPINSEIYYNYDNPIIMGANNGQYLTLDIELSTTNNYFKGKISDIEIYAKDISNYSIRSLFMNKFNYKDLKWNAPIRSQDYIEEIERFFMNKIPGIKSQYYNIRLKGLQISDTSIRGAIEDIIRNTVKKINPVHTELYNIIWEDQ